VEPELYFQVIIHSSNPVIRIINNNRLEQCSKNSVENIGPKRGEVEKRLDKIT